MLPFLISFSPGIFTTKIFSGGLSVDREWGPLQLCSSSGLRVLCCVCVNLCKDTAEVTAVFWPPQSCSTLNPPGCPPEADVPLEADTQAVPRKHWLGSSRGPSQLHQFAYQQCGGNNMCCPAFVDVKRLLMGTLSPQTVTDTVTSCAANTDKNVQPCLSPRRSRRCCKGFLRASSSSYVVQCTPDKSSSNCYYHIKERRCCKEMR